MIKKIKNKKNRSIQINVIVDLIRKEIWEAISVKSYRTNGEAFKLLLDHLLKTKTGIEHLKIGKFNFQLLKPKNDKNE